MMQLHPDLRRAIASRLNFGAVREATRAAMTRVPPDWRQKLLARLRLSALAPSLTYQARPQLEALIRQVGSAARVVDLGAGGRRIGPNVVSLDFAALPGTDIVASVSATPFADGSVDLAIATGVLEHVESADAMLKEIQRIVAPGGLVHIEIPFLQHYHDAPIDCRRLTLAGLERVVSDYGFEVEQSGVHIGPSVAVITLLTHYAALFFEGPTTVHKVLANAVFIAFSYLLFPLKFLDRYLVKKPSAHRLAFAVYATARKPGGATAARPAPSEAEADGGAPAARAAHRARKPSARKQAARKSKSSPSD